MNHRLSRLSDRLVDRPALSTVALTLLLMVIGVIPGCVAAERPETGTLAPSPVVNPQLIGPWSLRDMRGEAVIERIGGSDVGEMPSLTIAEDGSLSGAGGVNRWNASLNLSHNLENAFRVNAIAATRRAGPPRLMAVERDFFEALNEASHFDEDRLGEGRLILMNEDHEPILGFTRTE